ncbi:hypothetical protein PT2222_270067 [Paraburkholderia tropica]
MRGAERVVHVDVAELRHLLRQLVGILLLALVDAAVFEQHDVARLDVHAVFHPVRDQRHVAAEQFGQTLRDRRERVFGLEFALGRAAQMGRDHDSGARIQRGLDGRHGGAHAGVFGDVAVVVLRHVQVGADEHPLALELAFGDQIGKTQNLVHGHVILMVGRR